MQTNKLRKTQLFIGVMLVVIILFQETQSFTELSLDNFFTVITKHHVGNTSRVTRGF
jgi:hypothetical protein